MTDPTPATPEQPTIPTAPPVPAARAGETIPDPSQPHDPWSREAATETVAVPHAAGAPAATPPPAPPYQLPVTEVPTSYPATQTIAGPPKRRPRRLLVVSAIVVIVIILAAGGAWAYTALSSSSSSDPAAAVPAATAAFASLDVSGGNAAAVNSLAAKFGAPADAVAALESGISQSLGLDYATSVKPWFSGKAGIGVWFRTSSDPVILLVLSTSDESAARSALGKLAAKEGPDEFGYTFENGYALIASDSSGSQAAADAAASAATSANLAGSSAYQSAKSHLSGNNVLLAYVDVSSLGKVLPMLTGSDTEAGSGALSGSASTATAVLSLLKGTVVLGVAPTSDGVEIRLHAEIPAAGALVSATGVDAKAALDALPDDTLVGVAVRGIPPDSPTSQQLASLLPTIAGSALSSDPDAAQALQALADPLTKLLESKVISFALTGIGPAAGTSGEITAETQSASDAQSILGTVQQLTGGSPVAGLNVTASGATVQATFGTPGTGKLSSNALYTEATEGLSNEALAGFVNVQQLLTAASSGSSDSPLAALARVQAIGFGATSSSTASDALIRVIVK